MSFYTSYSHSIVGTKREASSREDDVTSPPKVPRLETKDCNGDSDRHSDSEAEFSTEHAQKAGDLHMTSAQGQMEHKCDECNLVYTRLEGLEGHHSTHGGEQPYKCQVRYDCLSHSQINIHSCQLRVFHSDNEFSG